MKVNGFSLRAAIRNRELQRDTAIAALPSVLQGTSDQNAEELMERIEKFEKEIAKLQAFQSRYNLEVHVDLVSEKISLAEAVKRLGGIERVSSRWRNLTMTSSISSSPSLTPSLNSSSAIRKSKQCAMELSVLRGRMTTANSTEIEIPELDENLMK